MNVSIEPRIKQGKFSILKMIPEGIAFIECPIVLALMFTLIPEVFFKNLNQSDRVGIFRRHLFAYLPYYTFSIRTWGKGIFVLDK